MKIIETIKKTGDYSGGVYYAASRQFVKLPELLASGESVCVSFYANIDDVDFFFEEMPGNINGSIFNIYFDSSVLPISTTNKVRRILKNNQDVVGYCFKNVNLIEKGVMVK